MDLDLILGVAAAAIVSVAACRLVIAAGIWDAPHLDRHQHCIPTPTSGGLGIAAGYAVGVLTIVLAARQFPHLQFDPVDAMQLAMATAFAFAFLIIGFIDDTYPLGPRGKLAVFVLTSVCAALAVGVAQVFPFGPGLVVDVGFVPGLIGSVLWIFTLVNGVNFMDGANGLAMGSVGVGMMGLAVIGFDTDAPDVIALALCAAAANAGFLIWNYPHGKLFAGDSGALFVGALAALGSLLVLAQGAVSPFVPPMLFFPLLADVLLTLAWRAKQGRNLLHGHSDHVYQIAIRAGFSHGRISFCYWIASALCGIGAVTAERLGGAWPLYFFAAMALASIMVSTLVRRTAQ